MKAVFDQNYVKRLEGTYIKKGNTKAELVEQVRADIRSFEASEIPDWLVIDFSVCFLIP